MKMRALLLIAALGFAACKQNTDTSSPQAGSAPAQLEAGGPGATGPDSRPPADRLLEAKRQGSQPVAVDSQPAAQPTSKAPPGEAEVEFMGQVTAKGLKAKQYLIFISKQPCDLKAATVQHFGSTVIPYGDSQNFFIEVFVPQGATGYVCAAALDQDRRAIAQGTYEKNPLKMEGEGEVIFDQLHLQLQPTKAPVALPKGL